MTGIETDLERPHRPPQVEFAAAILIVGGVTGILGGLLALLLGPTVPASAGLLPLVSIAVSLVTIAIGLLVHQGRLWRVCINVVAVVIVLYLTALPNPLAFFYLVLDGLVVVLLLRQRAWFDWHPAPASMAT